MTATVTPLREARTPATHPEKFDTGEVRFDDGEVRSVSATGGEKGTKLARYSLIPAAALRELAEHYGRGSQKYADNNWRLGYEWSKSLDALQRHLGQFADGEDFDEETGSKHIIAVAWHAIALATFMDEHPKFDDRYSTVKAREATSAELEKLKTMAQYLPLAHGGRAA
ncbi:dATP/dGTP diphosphohydrolase domain-containing protein [Rhodococcoides fascians]|uniref:dATP/dGTP diphosphohydrolase domain-containing protein n=1 Tax=Rhodococcoides fascians TaxID=1828 RepID=UPI00068B0883|nr:dATP/dGTP diphosphohydrolase domain-containing protein [Rhodococcus fascians]